MFSRTPSLFSCFGNPSLFSCFGNDSLICSLSYEVPFKIMKITKFANAKIAFTVMKVVEININHINFNYCHNGTIWYLTDFLIHHEWNGAWLLVKIVQYKYKLSQTFLNNLRLTILGNEKLEKSQDCMES